MFCLRAGRGCYQRELYFCFSFFFFSPSLRGCHETELESDCKKKGHSADWVAFLSVLVAASSVLPLTLVLTISDLFIAWPHVARGSLEL